MSGMYIGAMMTYEMTEEVAITPLPIRQRKPSPSRGPGKVELRESAVHILELLITHS